MPAVACALENDEADDGKQTEDDHRDRHRAHKSLADDLVLIAERADRLATGPQQRQPAEDRHAAQGDDERRHLELADAEPLQQPADKSNRQRRSNRGRHAITGRLTRCAHRQQAAPSLFHRRRHQAGKGQQRPDGEVDAAGQDDERHAYCQHAID